MVIRILLATLVLLSLPLQALTQLDASIDKNPALLGESITLDVTADSKVNADAINFRVLEQDFTVMVPSVSQSTRIINGQSSQSTSWKVVLLPKKAGTFEIPSFSLQGASTQPMQLTILAADSAKAANTDQELFLQSSLEDDNLYVQQLSYYKVQIFFTGDLQRGSLSEPQLDGATIAQIGQDEEGSELVNGIRYRTISRRYAITPQQSGNFTILPPTFSGEMVDRDSARYNYFARTKTVVQQAQPVDVVVKAAPSNFPGDWLVAGLVTLTEEWTPAQNELNQGEPITRTITLSAVDVAENQLPELTQDYPPTLRLYQEQPQAKSAERSGHLIAQKIFTTAIIATQDGTVTLPEIRLPWWNSKTNQIAYATLPAKTFKVAPSATSATTALPNVASASPTPQPQSTVIPYASDWAWTYSSSLMLALWFISVIVFSLMLRTRKPDAVKLSVEKIATFNAGTLKKACQDNDALTAKAELLRWGLHLVGKHYYSLSQLAADLNSAALREQLHQLNADLYAADTPHWQGQPLWQSWTSYKHNTQATSQADSLNPLYPE